MSVGPASSFLRDRLAGTGSDDTVFPEPLTRCIDDRRRRGLP